MLSTDLKRIFVSTSVAIIAFNITAVVAWILCHDSLLGRSWQTTRWHYSLLQRQLKDYQAQHRALPESLAALKLSNAEDEDGWGHPFVYERKGDSFTVRSLGANNAPGGEGIDADITLGAKAKPIVTLRQFLFSPRFSSVRWQYFWCCFANGFLWGIAIFSGCKENAKKKTSPILEAASLLGLLVVFVVTTLWAVLQLVLELTPSGH